MLAGLYRLEEAGCKLVGGAPDPLPLRKAVESATYAGASFAQIDGVLMCRGLCAAELLPGTAELHPDDSVPASLRAQGVR